MPNLLALVDLVSTNRTKVYRTSYFPFLQALARAHGWHVRWLCVGVDAEVQASRENPFIFHLPAGDRELLGERLAELKPDRVLFNERLDGDTWEHLAAAAAGAAMGRVTADVPGWLGGNERRRPGQERPRLTEQELEPDHRRELVNPLAARIKPYVWLMLGPFCLYRRPLKQNLSFLGVDLSGCSRDDTCSFCTPPVDERPPADVVGAALAQILAAERSTPKVCRSREYVVDGGALWFKIGPFLDAVLARDLPPSAFFFHCRADDLLAKAAEVEARLPLLENAGHSLNIFSIGVENFSRAENQRFNKKIDPEMVQMAAELMYRWEERVPRSFCFSSHGGFSFILYTPWTNLEDLEANIQGLKRLRPYCTEVEFALRRRRGHHGHGEVGPDDAGHHVDLLGLDHLVGQLHCNLGLALVVFDHDL